LKSEVHVSAVETGFNRKHKQQQTYVQYTFFFFFKTEKHEVVYTAYCPDRAKTTDELYVYRQNTWPCPYLSNRCVIVLFREYTKTTGKKSPECREKLKMYENKRDEN
jgi:hypothetical protein